MRGADLGTDPVRSPAHRGRGVLAIGLLVLLLAGVAGAGLAWRAGIIPHGSIGLDLSADPTPEPTVDPARAAADAAAQRLALDSERIAALETRVAALNRAADAAAGSATHAETIMIVAAARRAVERGEPLGYLANELRLRFGAAEPVAVERAIAASQHPVTLAALTEELERTAPALGAAAPQGGWEWLRREASDIFTIRSNGSEAPDPSARLQRARLYLAGNRVDMAIGEVQRMPGQATARAWLARAREFRAAQEALDKLEARAILEASPLAQPKAAVPPPEPVAAPGAAPTPAPGAAPAPVTR